MSDIVITLLLIVPIIIVIVIINNANKRRKKKAQKRINAHIGEATRQTGITNYFRKQLIHQTVIIDESNRKLLIIDHKGDAFSFNAYPLDAINSILTINKTQSFIPEGKGQKQEHIITNIGIELTFEKKYAEQFLVLYDHLEHSIHQMADFKKEAGQLHDTIRKAQNGNQTQKG
jgi:hypothetical protein